MKEYLIAAFLLLSPTLTCVAQEKPPVQEEEQNLDARTIDALISQVKQAEGKKQVFEIENISVSLWSGGYYLTIGLGTPRTYNPFTGKKDNFFGILYDHDQVTLLGRPQNYISMKDKNYDGEVDSLIDYRGNITSHPKGKKPIEKTRNKEELELFKKADALLKELNETYRFEEFKKLQKKFYVPKPKQEPKWF